MAEFIQEIPKVGSRFRNPEEAWKYWVDYGGRMGFDVRKRYTNKSSFDKKVTSCKYVCSNEGHRRKGTSDHVTKCFRAETRTDCKVRMTLTLDRGEDNYEVTDVELEHNHLLHLPETLTLKRWTREASSGSIQDRQGRKVLENPRHETQLNYRYLSPKFLNLAYKAASSSECCLLLDNALDCLGTQLEDKLNVSSGAMNEKPCNDQENVEPNVQQRDDLLSAAKLKTKDGQSKRLRRNKTWLDKFHKSKRKSIKSFVPTKKTTKQQKKKSDTQPLVELEHDDNNRDVELQEYDAIGNFTQLITTSNIANVELPDLL